MDVMESIELKDIKNQVRQVLEELLKVAHLKPGQILMAGCSSSRIDSFKIDSYSNGDIGVAVFSTLNKELKPLGIFLAAQCCEYLNRTLILEEEATEHYGYETVNMAPQLKTGSSSATTAYVVLGHPVAVKHIKAHTGIDIEDILIGMHLRDVAVLVHIRTKEVGDAHIVCARARPKLIGNVRAHYDEEHMQHQLVKREEVLFISKAITISRQYDSGGHELGEKLAMKLGVPFYDKELITMIAKEGNIEPSILEANDEMEPNLDNYSTRLIEPEYQIAMTQHIYAVQETVIKSLAEKGSCVIIGHCADAILPHTVNISVFTDMESRIKRIMSLSPELSRDETRGGINIVDKRRKAYHEYYSPIEWGKMEAYDICLDNRLIEVDGCLDTALAYISHVK